MLSMFDQNVFWYFFICLFTLYIVMILAGVSGFIPDLVKRNINAKETKYWRIGIIIAGLIEIAGSVIMILRSKQDYKSMWNWIFLGLGIFLIVLGFAVIYFVNKKYIEHFDPGFYDKKKH